MSLNHMTLRIYTPERLVLKERVDKIVSEAVNGFFCLLPRHIDYLAGLVPGVFTYTVDESEHYLAVDKGILVKSGFEVVVSVRSAIQGDSLEELEDQARNKFERTDQKEQEINVAMDQLEADFIRRFVEMNEQRSRG